VFCVWYADFWTINFRVESRCFSSDGTNQPPPPMIKLLRRCNSFLEYFVVLSWHERRPFRLPSLMRWRVLVYEFAFRSVLWGNTSLGLKLSGVYRRERMFVIELFLLVSSSQKNSGSRMENQGILSFAALFKPTLVLGDIWPKRQGDRTPRLRSV
jgi:hypothetical protein